MQIDAKTDKKSDFETVLILQGGGSLGAYECGVYKALEKHDIRFDIVAGTSIGSVNAAIIAGSKNNKVAKSLEEFWLNLAETITLPFLPEQWRAYSSSMYSALWGNPKAFQPIWFSPEFFNATYSYPYLYDITPLKETLKKYVDFNLLKNPNIPRLIITTTDIQNGKPAIFDSKYDSINVEHLLASAGYPFYGISWTEISGRYLWDGTLLSNTPLVEVINASPKNDKKVFVVDLFPHKQEEIPKNMFETWHRARDIMFTDKTDNAIRMSKIISRYLGLIKEMHDIIKSAKLDENTKEKFEHVESEYHKLACERGAIIKEIIRVERSESNHFLFEDADFSISTIKQLIDRGEKDAEKILSSKKQM